MSSLLDAYNLSDWPFREVPQASRCDFLVGRPELAEALRRLLSTSSPVSAIHLFWASLGAGKTHALYFLVNQMKSDPRFLPVYTEYPDIQAGFVRLYQLFAQQVPWDAVADSCLHLFTNPDPKANDGLSSIKAVHPDLYRAFFLLAEGESAARERLARRWLRGEPLVRVELRECGFAASIDSPADCAAAVSVLARILALKRRMTHGTEDFRVVWIIDECQRLGNAPKRLNEEVNAGLQSTFNASPDYLTLILSFTGAPNKSLPGWLRPELADRIGARNLLLLPPMARQQAKAFFRELLAHFRRSPSSDPFFPFTEASVDCMLARVLGGKLAFLGELTESSGVRPRALIKCAHSVLEEHMHVEASLPIDEKFVAGLFPK